MTQVHIVVYNWGHEDANPPVIDEELLMREVEEVCGKLLQEKSKRKVKTPRTLFSESLVKEFLTSYRDQLYHVGKLDMLDWLLPSFLPVPIIVSRLNRSA